MKVRIIVKTSLGTEIFNEVFKAKNENEALMEFLEIESINAGDTIEIEEEE